MLKIENLQVHYGGIQALRGISLEVPDGRIVTLIGANGAGKSTTLRTVTGLVKASGGSVQWDGQELLGKSIDKIISTGIAMSPEGRRVFPDMTVLENLKLAPMKLKKMSDEDATAQAEALLKKVGLLEKADAYPASLSGGQKQRIAIARTLAMNPDVILFDEPTSALDPEMVGEVLNLIRELAREGMTMIIVTHEMAFARDVSSRILFIDDRNICVDSEPKEFFENPANDRVRDFLGHFNK